MCQCKIIQNILSGGKTQLSISAYLRVMKLFIWSSNLLNSFFQTKFYIIAYLHVQSKTMLCTNICSRNAKEKNKFLAPKEDKLHSKLFYSKFIFIKCFFGMKQWKIWSFKNANVPKSKTLAELGKFCHISNFNMRCAPT